MKMILECRVKQKQMAPNSLRANNLYQLKLLAHCITFIMCPSPVPKQCLGSFRVEDASYLVGSAEILG